MDLLDVVATVLLFIGLLPWVWACAFVGAISTMLSDSGAPGLAWVGLLLAVVGMPVTAVAAFVVAAVAAVRADGPTFYYPLVALGLGTLAAAVVWALGYGIVVLNLALFGNDEDRRRESSPEPADIPEAVPTGFRYIAVNKMPDRGMMIEIGFEKLTGRRYLRTPMPQRGGEYEEYYGIDVATYLAFISDRPAALRFAAECRGGLHRNLWLPPAGFPAWQPITDDHTRLAGRIAILLTDRPTTADGAPVAGLPLGTPFVRIVDDTPDQNGDLGVRLPTGDGEVVRVAAGHLGRPY